MSNGKRIVIFAIIILMVVGMLAGIFISFLGY